MESISRHLCQSIDSRLSNVYHLRRRADVTDVEAKRNCLHRMAKNVDSKTVFGCLFVFSRVINKLKTVTLTYLQNGSEVTRNILVLMKVQL